MEISQEIVENVVVLTLSGNLLGEKDSIPIKEIVTNNINKGIINVIFDVEKLEYINSTGLSVLISTLTKVNKAEGKLSLVKVQDQLKTLLDITKLNSIFQQNDSIEEAIKTINA